MSAARGPNETGMGAPSVAAIASRRAPVRVLIPSLLWSYTGGAKRIDVEMAGHESATPRRLADLLAEIERRFPGFRFRIIDEQGRIRPHIKIFVDGDLARDPSIALGEGAEVMIVGALSGG